LSTAGDVWSSKTWVTRKRSVMSKTSDSKTTTKLYSLTPSHTPQTRKQREASLEAA
jgi:hypothetical protein